ncbi:MAG TPA: [protein-PII] uridylyltransferase [Candidatus Limnocylindria bacterium]|nr:[protein-PII] uridylyltransferase [Candidatus Limnocylindria bacterium]
MIFAAAPSVAPLAATTTLPEPDGNTAGMATVARRYVEAVQQELRERHEAGAGGLAVVAAYTDAIDRLIRYLFENANRDARARNARLKERLTLVAQGGYGRGELNVHSDIDLLILYPWKVTPHIETVTENVLLALIDARLSVGSALRNARECVRLAARDFKVKTALLDARYVCGDEALYAEFDSAMLSSVWSADQQKFMAEKLAENEERHARAGHSVYLLQPDLKEGQGGLRDLHTALWLAKVRYRVRSVRELVPLGVLRMHDVEALEQALDFLWRVRNAMHFATGRHHDRLSFELQDQLAPALGFGEGREGVERFMREYYRQATVVSNLSDWLVAQCRRGATVYRAAPAPVRTIREGMRIRENELSVVGRHVFEADPTALVTVFAETQRHEVTLSPTTAMLVRECAPLLEPVREAEAARRAFREILGGRTRVYETLTAMHRIGVLRVLLPEFAHLECLVSHDPFHVYTVDHHSLVGVREIETLRSGALLETEPLLTGVARELAGIDLLVLSMLCHDIGKGRGGEHSQRGSVLMDEVCRRLGLNEDEAATCKFLVANHLHMSHLAQRRDIGDDALVAEFCRTCGSVQNLQHLFVLTYADMTAVAPGVWNEWRGGLVTDLYKRALEVLERGLVAAEDRAARAARVRARTVGAAAPAERDAVQRFVDVMPESYFLSTPEDAIRRHVALMRRYRARAASDGRSALVTDLAEFADRGFCEFTICTGDRPGLFAMVSGALATHGLDVVGARIITSRDAVAFDAFRVRWHPGMDPSCWERVEATLRGVLAGTIDVERLVAQAVRPALFTRKRRPIPTVVAVDNRVSESYTVIDIETGDRVGLLFGITNCFYHLGVDIHLAKINTMDDRVFDVFYVTDVENRKIEDPARLEEIRAALLAALEPQAAEPQAAAS